MKFLIVILSIIFPEILFSQVTNLSIVKKALCNNDLSLYRKFVDSAFSDDNCISDKWIMDREIIPGIRECVFGKSFFRKSLNENEPGDCDSYRINTLSNRNKIFYCAIYKHDSTIKRYILVDSSINKKLYIEFENRFEINYGLPFKVGELFSTSIFYGEHCGAGGGNPEYRTILDKLIETNQIDSLRVWIRSVNIEKQLYGYRGFRILILKGYKPSNKEKLILQLIRHKEGKITTCVGCMIVQDSIKYICEQLDKSELNKLMPESNESYFRTIDIHSEHFKVLIFLIIIIVFLAFIKLKSN